jgi:hypothetical protein
MHRRNDVLFSLSMEERMFSKENEREDLMRRQNPERESVLLVRTRHATDWFAHFLSFGQALIAVLAIVTCILAILAFCLSDLLIKLWKAWVGAWPQFLLQFLGQAPDARHIHQVILIDVFFCILLLTGGAYLLTKRAIKELRGLLASARQQAPGSTPFSIREYVRFSSAPWLLPQVIEAPSLTTVLDILQDHESTSEAWSRELARFLEERQQEPPPAISMLVSLSEQVTVSLIGQDGKQESLHFPHPQQAALVAFFALQPRGTWIPRQKVIKQVYGAEGAHLFALHISRIHAAINKVAREGGLLTENDEETAQPQEKLKLFEYDESAQDHLWRRVVSCEVEVFGELEAFYQRVKTAEENGTRLQQEELRSGCHQLMQMYGRGYLAEHQAPKTIWSWARDGYIEYRDKCLFLLKYTAEREWELAHRLQGNERYEAIRQAALLPGWFALVANGIVPLPHIEQAEEALCRSLKLYCMLRDIAAAKAIYQAYAQQAKSRDARWRPKQKITEIWPEATAEESPDAGARKNARRPQR